MAQIEPQGSSRGIDPVFSSAPPRRRRVRLPENPILICIGWTVLLWLILIAAHFPYHTDERISDSASAALRASARFYETAYTPGSTIGTDEKDTYALQAQRANAKTIRDLQGFVQRFQLYDRRILDVGAGNGYLQDLVANYTALDISPQANRFFHKPFVAASATAIPFQDDTFDTVWSIVTMEHVVNPEQGLREMRRVVKDGGYIYLRVTWNCPPWLAAGYPVRSFGELPLWGKLVKLSLAVRAQTLFQMSYLVPTRMIRYSTAKLFGPTSLHYRQLQPNYDHYWMPDADAVNSLDSFETLLWFLSRGDECIDCSALGRSFTSEGGDVVVRVHKPRMR